MTQEEFIKVLEFVGYSYEIEGDKLVVTHEGDLEFNLLKELPPNLVFRNRLKTIEYRGCNVYLKSLETLPPGLEFSNSGNVTLESLKTLTSDVIFNNGGYLWLESIKTLPQGIEFRNGGNIYFKHLSGIPTDVRFNNGGDVNIALIVGDFSLKKCNIEGIKSNRLLNIMIKRGMFI